MRVLATVWRGVESRTAQGGVAVFYEAVGSVWMKLGARRRTTRGEAEAAVVVETLRAEARADPRLEEGLRLRFSGAEWLLVMVDASGAVGRVKLELERVR